MTKARRLMSYTDMIRRVFGADQATLYHQAVKAQRDPKRRGKFPGEDKLKLKVYSKKAGMARIKLNQADLRCPWMLFYVLHKVARTVNIGSPMCVVDGAIIRDVRKGTRLPWATVAKVIREYTGTDRLPRGMAEEIRHAFVLIANKQHVRAAERRGLPSVRGLQLNCVVKLSERYNLMINRLDTLLTKRLQNALAKVALGVHTSHVGNMPSAVYLCPVYPDRKIRVDVNREDWIRVRQHIRSQRVVDVHGYQTVVLSAYRWCTYSDLVFVSYLTYRGKTLCIAEGWAKPVTPGSSDFGLVSILDVTKEIEAVRKRHGLISVHPRWLGLKM